MNRGDLRERDSILKMLRRRLPDPNRPIKKTTPELMAELTSSFQEDYEAGVGSRAEQARVFFDNDKKGG